MKKLFGGLFVIALIVFNISINKNSTNGNISVSSMSTLISHAQEYNDGGLIPLLDEMQRECSIPLGGGGSLGVDFQLQPEGIFTISWGGKYYRPTSIVAGKKLECTWAWACCTAGDCVPNS